jgi:hypothetical protein
LTASVPNGKSLGRRADTAPSSVKRRRAEHRQSQPREHIDHPYAFLCAYTEPATAHAIPSATLTTTVDGSGRASALMHTAS